MVEHSEGYAALKSPLQATVEPSAQVGSIIHYVLEDHEHVAGGLSSPFVVPHRPAIVVRQIGEQGVVDLTFFIGGADMPGGASPVQHKMGVPYSDSKVPGSWHFAEGAGVQE